MSDESEATRKPARALNRWRIGSLSAFQTLLLAFVVLCANYLAFHHYQRVDMSRDADYSLSPPHAATSPAMPCKSTRRR